MNNVYMETNLEMTDLHYRNGVDKKRTIGGRSRITLKNYGNITNTKGRGTYLRNWSKQSPGYHERTVMMKRCGKKCFLGPNKTFPICRKNTCKRNRKGVYSAFIRAREYMTIKGTRKYANISAKAKKLLSKY